MNRSTTTPANHADNAGETAAVCEARAWLERNHDALLMWALRAVKSAEPERVRA